MELSVDIIVLLTAVAFVAGFVDAIAGGGGLLTVPAMLIAGMDPVSTLATNKLQGTFGAGAASLNYARHGAADWRSVRLMMALSGAAAAFGALFVASIPIDLVKAALPFILLVVALYFLLAPRPGTVDTKPRLSQPVFTSTFVPAIAFYDGAIGPGTGSFFTLSFLALRGQTLLRATANAKLLNFMSNLGALAVFFFAGKLVWLVGLTMAVGSIAGAQLGSRLAISKGAAVIRPLIVVACSAMAAKLLLG